MNNYFIKFHASGSIEWLTQSSFDAAFNYVEKQYGKSWRNLCSICSYQIIEA